MNSNIILIAQDVDMFDDEVQVINPELPELPETLPSQTQDYTTQVAAPVRVSEKDAFIGKTLQMCLWLAISIVIILAIALLYKKVKEGIAPKNNNEIDEADYQKAEEQPEYIQSPVRKNKLSKLNTPSSIHQCILAFLEITKEN